MRWGLRWRFWGIIVIGFASMVWMTGYLGHTYIKLITQPRTSSVLSSPGAVPAAESQVNLADLDFWTCQTGVFQTEENARREKDRLEQLGWRAEIVSQKPWSVAIGFAHTSEELTPLRHLLKERGVETVAKHFSVPGQAYRVTGNGAEQTVQILRAVQNYLQVATDQRGEALTELGKESSTPGPKKLDALYQAIRDVLQVQTLGSKEEQCAMLTLLAQYQNTLQSHQK